MDESQPTRNLALELARVTEAAALAAIRWRPIAPQWMPCA
jgi:hypothetical protein